MTRLLSRGSSLAFWCSAAVLLIAVIAIDPAIARVRQAYTKLPIDIRVPLAEFDVSSMPSFTRVPALREMIWYEQDIETHEKTTLTLRRRTPLASGQYAEALLHMAYYSDPNHQVAHTPEVCFRQDGGIINALSTVDIPAPELGALSPIQAKFVDIQRTPTARIIDLYLFICNGKLYHDRDRLRLAIGMPGDRHVYFCKVEVAVVCDKQVSMEEAREIAQQVMREAVPILLHKHLPTDL